MAQTSKNSFDLIGMSLHRLEGKFTKAFLGTICMVLPLALLLCIPYAGWALAIFFWGIFDTGYIRFMRKLINGENPALKEVFSEFKTGWLELFLGVCLLIMFLLGTVIAIVPGIVLVGYYSMSMFVAEHYQLHDVGKVLVKTADKMDGHKTTMFSYKVLFYFVYLLLIVGFGVAAFFIYTWFATSPVLAVLVAVLAFLLLVLIWSLVTVYYHAANQTFFDEILVYEELRKQKRAEKAAAEAPVAEAPVEPAPVVEEPVKVAPKTTKAAPKKTTTKTATKTTKTTTKKTTK